MSNTSPQKSMIATAPMRIDFAGGTIDLPPLYLFHHPAPTVNLSVAIRATVKAEPGEGITIVSEDQSVEAHWPDWQSIDWESYPMLELVARIAKSFEVSDLKLTVSSEAPAGSGLGGSSVIAIATTALLAEITETKLDKIQLVERAKSIETQTIKVPTGYQDYWGAVYGGVNAYQVELDGGLTVEPLGSAEFRSELEKNIMLVYVGKPHFSGANNWELFKQHIDGSNGVPEFFESLKENGVAMADAFKKEDLAAIASVLNQDWKVRKAMLPAMTTPEIELLTEQAMAAGAFGLRVCGAGAGGCVLLMVSPDKQPAVKAVIESLQMVLLPSGIAPEGVSVKPV